MNAGLIVEAGAIPAYTGTNITITTVFSRNRGRQVTGFWLLDDSVSMAPALDSFYRKKHYKNNIYFGASDTLFGCFNGKLYFIDPGTGKINATFQPEESIKRYNTGYGDNDEFKKDFEQYGNDYINSEKQ